VLTIGEEHVVLPLEEFKAKQRAKLGKITSIFQKQVQSIHTNLYIFPIRILPHKDIEIGKNTVEQTISEVNAVHEDITNKITHTYKACKAAIQRRYDELMRDSEQIRSSKGNLTHSPITNISINLYT
jgi:hypothetical protein